MIKKFLILIIHVYQYTISPFFGNCCKFHPSCSEYGKEAIKKHGAIFGLYLITKRIIKCNPFHKGGYDPID